MLQKKMRPVEKGENREDVFLLLQIGPISALDQNGQIKGRCGLIPCSFSQQSLPTFLFALEIAVIFRIVFTFTSFLGPLSQAGTIKVL